MTCTVFWRRVSLQDMAAGSLGADSRTPRSNQPNFRERTTSSGQRTINFCTHQFTIFQQCFVPYSWCIVPPNSGPAPVLSPKLAGDNSRPVGTPSSSGLQVGTAGNPSPEVAATNSGYQEPSPDRGGGAEANGQGCSKDGHPPCRSISQ